MSFQTAVNASQAWRRESTFGTAPTGTYYVFSRDATINPTRREDRFDRYSIANLYLVQKPRTGLRETDITVNGVLDSIFLLSHSMFSTVSFSGSSAPYTLTASQPQTDPTCVTNTIRVDNLQFVGCAVSNFTLNANANEPVRFTTRFTSRHIPTVNSSAYSNGSVQTGAVPFVTYTNGTIVEFRDSANNVIDLTTGAVVRSINVSITNDLGWVHRIATGDPVAVRLLRRSIQFDATLLLATKNHFLNNLANQPELGLNGTLTVEFTNGQTGANEYSVILTFGSWVTFDVNQTYAPNQLIETRITGNCTDVSLTAILPTNTY